MTTPVSSTDSESDLRTSFTSMASQVRFWVHHPNAQAAHRLDRAQSIFEAVAHSCTRFDPSSALMQANAAGKNWASVPAECFDAIAAALEAHQETSGLFDPRTLTALTSLGYGSTLPFETQQISLTSDAGVRGQKVGRIRPWKPGFDVARSAVRVGDEPIDLGGIGKGLAVRWCANELRDAGESILVEAGGDVMAIGVGPNGDGWMISVESPMGGSDPVAVLRLTDRAVATSSIRIRSWVVDGEQVHHIIDRRTRRPAQSFLRSVTVVHDDPAYAEVWSKSLFIVGRSEIRKLSDDKGLAALWVDVEGRVTLSRAMREYVAWQVSDV